MLWYAAVITGIYLVGYTGAAFNDVENTNMSLHVRWPVKDEPPEGKWDKSSLEFIGFGGDCSGIYAVVKNGADSEAMAGPVSFEVYWIAKGNAKNGEVVYTGTIDPLDPGESVTLEYTPNRSGNYKFKAYQRPGHPGQGELWSDGPEAIICGDSLKTADQVNEEEPESLMETMSQEMIENENAEDNGTGEGASTDTESTEIGDEASTDKGSSGTEDEASTDTESPGVGEDNGETPAAESPETSGETEAGKDKAGSKDTNEDTGATAEN